MCPGPMPCHLWPCWPADPGLLCPRELPVGRMGYVAGRLFHPGPSPAPGWPSQDSRQGCLAQSPQQSHPCGRRTSRGTRGDLGDPLWKAGSSPGRPESVTNGQNVRVMESKHGRPGHGLWPRQSLAAVCLTSPSVFLLISRTQIGKEISLQMLRCRNAPSRQGSNQQQPQCRGVGGPGR